MEREHIFTPIDCQYLALNALKAAVARDHGAPKGEVATNAYNALQAAKTDPSAWAKTDDNIQEFINVIEAVYGHPDIHPGAIYDAVEEVCLTHFKKAQS